jgi:prevent-host-death family protein
MGKVSTVSIDEAKTTLSCLLECVLAGDEIVITKAGTVAAKLTSVHAQRNSLPYGLLKGKLKVKPGFDDRLPDDLIASLEGR